MFAHMRVHSADGDRRGTASCQGRLAVTLTLIFCALVLQGCANPPPSPDAGRAAADPEARAPATVYRPATAPYVSRRPVDPKAWRDPNDTANPPKP